MGCYISSIVFCFIISLVNPALAIILFDGIFEKHNGIKVFSMMYTAQAIFFMVCILVYKFVTFIIS